MFELEMPYWLKRRLKKKIFFSYRRFLIAVFLGGEKFSRILKAYYYRPVEAESAERG
jgi:hypothetical protein